jgi:hypothetical protein
MMQPSLVCVPITAGFLPVRAADDVQSDADAAGEGSMGTDSHAFMQPPEASLSARAGSRILSMFNMHSGRSTGSDTVDSAPPALLKARYSSLSGKPGAGPRGRSVFSTPGGVLRTTNTFSSGQHSQHSHTTGEPVSTLGDAESPLV